MNNRTAIGLVLAVIIVGILLFALDRTTPTATQIPLGTTTAPTSATSTNVSASTTSASGLVPMDVTTAAAAPAASAPHVDAAPAPEAAFDVHNEVATTGRPIITGTANGSPIELVFTNSAGVGVAGASVDVVDGHWRYAPALTLPPGTYTLQIVAGNLIVADTLTISS